MLFWQTAKLDQSKFDWIKLPQSLKNMLTYTLHSTFCFSTGYQNTNNSCTWRIEHNKYTEQNYTINTVLSQYQLLSELYFISNFYSAKADQIKKRKLPPLHAYPALEQLFHHQLFHQPGFLEVQATNFQLKRQAHLEMVLPMHHLLLWHALKGKCT